MTVVEQKAAGGTPASATTTKVVPAKTTGLRIFGYVVLAAVVVFLVVIAFNPNFRWRVIGEFLFHPQIISGIGTTLLLTAISMVAGTLIGVVLALMKLSPARQLSVIADGYIWVFRGVPLLVQLLIWFNLAALFPQIGIGIPGTDIMLFSLNANDFISPFTAALLALSLHEGAYMAEIVRSGILSIDKGQSEAAQALGMRPGKIMIRVVLPQAMRVIIPPTGNQVISMLKTTSLVSVIALTDLLYSAQVLYGVNYQVIPLLIVASIWYLFMVSILTVIQSRIERHFSRSDRARTAKK